MQKLLRLSFNSLQQKEQVMTRIVFAVTMEGSARKVITVRSALVLVNNLEEQIEVRLQKASGQFGGEY